MYINYYSRYILKFACVTYNIVSLGHLKKEEVALNQILNMHITIYAYVN